MEEIALKFTLSNYQCELAPGFIEADPRLEVYFTSEIDSKPVEVKLKENDEGKQVYEVEVKGKFSLRKKLPVNSKLVFSSFCTTVNEYGAPCMVDAGTSYVHLASILNAIHGVHTQDVRLRMHTAENFEKGRFQFTAKSKDLKLGRVKMETLKIGVTVKSAGKEADSSMAEYINKVMEHEMKLGATIPGTENVRCPFYYGQVGVEMTRCPVPAAGYVMYKVPGSNLNFWESNLKTVLAREDKDVSDVKRMSLHEQARVWAEMMVLETQYLDYIADKVDKNQRFMGSYKPRLRVGGEIFGDSLFTLDGDCEDLACAIMQTCASFRRADLKNHPELSILQQIGMQYVPIMSLDAVTAAAVGDSTDGKNIGAHMNVNLMPAPYVKECLKRAEAQGQKTNLPFRRDTKWAKHLPVLIAEGTGMFEPLGFNDTVEGERRYVYGNWPTLRAFKKPIVHQVGAPSTFFVGSLLGFTDYWFELGANVGGLWYTYPNSSGVPDRGVRFTDLEQKKSSVCILTHPPIPQTVMNRMKEAVALRMPPRDLILSERVKHPKTNEHLDALVNSVEATHLGGTIYQKPVAFYVRDYQLHPKVISSLISDVGRLDDVIKVDYQLESVTDEVYGYRVNVYADA